MHLVFIFGFWINLNTITYLNPQQNTCYVHFSGSEANFVEINNHTCNEVAQEIYDIGGNNIIDQLTAIQKAMDATNKHK